MGAKSFDNNVYLCATDTVVGFVSQNKQKLDQIKSRSPHKHYITALPSLKSLKKRIRVPQTHKNRIRRARRTTFVMPNGKSYRIIRDDKHRNLIKKLGWAYTTSANQTGQEYDEEWARKQADVIIEPLEDKTKKASKIYKLGKIVIEKIR